MKYLLCLILLGLSISCKVQRVPAKSSDSSKEISTDVTQQASVKELARMASAKEAARKASVEEAARKASAKEAARKASAEEAARKASIEEAAQKAAKREEQKAAIEDVVYMIVEDQPLFPGGEAAMMDYIYDNLQYPTEAKAQKIEGVVVISFVVEKDGTLTHIKTARDIGGGCGEEGLRLVKSMPNWTPGLQRGKPVRVSFNLPVRFELEK